jgi:hypothetical protein
MTVSKLFCLALAAGSVAHADFSYTTTRKGASMPGAAADQTTKTYLKGQKMMSEMGDRATIMDFDAQTITKIDRAKKTYTVSKFSDVNPAAAQDVSVTVDVKETGQHKTINGFDASEAVMSVQMDSPQTQQAGMKVQIEIDTWISPDVPGNAEREAFYKRNAGRYPWATMTEGANAGMRAAMVEMQKKMASLHGAAVLQIVRMKMGGAGAPGISPQQQAQMEKARAQMEAMQKQGGPQAAAATAALARMGSMSGGGGGGMEITSESTGFSASPIPESIFAIPAGYSQTEK